MITKNITAKTFFSLILLVGVGALITWHSIPAQEKKSENPLRLLTNNGEATAALSNLLSFFNIQAHTKEDIVKSTQATWLRAAGKERWEIDELEVSNKNELMALLTQAHVIDATIPTQKEYDYVLVLGGLQKRVHARLEYLIKLWNEGIRFKEILFLGSERTLDAQQEPAHAFQQNPAPATEHEMMQWVYHHSDIPAQMKAVAKTFVNTPNTTGVNGQIKRATTPDTLNTWLATKPQSGSVLVISNQPHIGYQAAVVETTVPAPFTIETVGPALSPETKISEILDAIARCIYQENKFLEAQSHK